MPSRRSSRIPYGYDIKLYYKKTKPIKENKDEKVSNRYGTLLIITLLLVFIVLL